MGSLHPDPAFRDIIPNSRMLFSRRRAPPIVRVHRNIEPVPRARLIGGFILLVLVAAWHEVPMAKGTPGSERKRRCTLSRAFSTLRKVGKLVTRPSAA
jgi:hypothetical protein